MFDHKTLPSAEGYFTPGSPEATLWDRSTVVRNAIARVHGSVVAVSPDVLYMPSTPAEPASVPAPAAAGEVALINTVNEVPEVPANEPTILDADPMHELSQEMFLEAARQEVEQAHGSDQGYADAA